MEDERPARPSDRPCMTGEDACPPQKIAKLFEQPRARNV